MKKILVLLLVILISSSSVLAAKYKVNTKGTVKQNGKVVSPTSPNKVPYSVYNSSQYVSSNTVNATQVGTIEIVMDYSGSMSNWIIVAKNTMSNIIAQIPSSTRVGFRVFGHNNHGSNPNNAKTLAQVKKIVKTNKKYKVVSQEPNAYLGSAKGYCAATEQVTPIAQANSSRLMAGMNSANLGGSTPLVYALDRTVNQDFLGMDRVSAKKIVLVTDGGENCGGDPCEFAKRLMAQRQDVHIDVVLVTGGFGSGLSCLADTTGGKVYKVNNPFNFSTTMSDVMTSQPKQVKTQQPSQGYEFYND